MQSIQESNTSASEDRFTIRDVLLIILTGSSGAVDAISYFGLGKIFLAFMTGNIVFLGFAIADLGGPEFLPVIVALVSFSVGAYLGTLLTLNVTEISLWPLQVSVVLGFTALAQAAFLAVWMAAAGQPVGAAVNILLCLASAAMALQTAAVRALGVKGVFTTAATFTLLAYAGDFAGARPLAERPRLAGVLLGLVGGAVAGGLLLIHARSYASILPLVATIAVAIIGVKVYRREAAAIASKPLARQQRRND
jgi:uncharacterized membrane protein YoaK (UPF0700 family)